MPLRLLVEDPWLQRLQRLPTEISRSRYRRLLTLHESQQVCIYLILVRRARSVRRARIDPERCITHNFRRQSGRVVDGHDLIVIVMQDQGRYVDLFEIFSEICLGKRLNAEVRSLSVLRVLCGPLRLCAENTQRKGAKDRKAREGLTTRYKSASQ